jgi:hypothetical protein
MRAALIDLYGRLSYPLPDLTAQVHTEETRTERSASAS